jgi:hypothetical protein
MRSHKIHYIGNEWNSKFIIAETLCGIYWDDCEEYTSEKERVSCKKCLKKLEYENHGSAKA